MTVITFTPFIIKTHYSFAIHDVNQTVFKRVP